VEDYTVVIGGSSLLEEKNPFSSDKNIKVTLYPNPVNDVLNISFQTKSDSITYSVVDLLGKTVITVTGKMKSTVDVGNLKQG
ncbi:T9SS type A sorting domain-containing protein, partial [Aquimarina celericrescens]|nr:T9SS type A sorting domain-containing protein [Aquimarina celericrescens]